MPIELLPHLRLLRFSLPAMKIGTSVPSSRSIPIFSRLFPFKLKYSALGPQFTNNQIRVRRLSTRPFRPRAGSSSEFTRGRDRGEVRASKSLIDDEADLSDWVSDFNKKSSFPSRVSSDDEKSDDRRGSRGISRGGGDRDRSRGSFEGRKTDSFRDSSRSRFNSGGKDFGDRSPSRGISRSGDRDKNIGGKDFGDRSPTRGIGRSGDRDRNSGGSFERKTDSFRGRPTSGGKDFGDRNRFGGRSGDNGREGARDSFPAKRRRDSDTDGLREPNSGRTQNSFGSRNSLGNKRFDTRPGGDDLSLTRKSSGSRDMGTMNRQTVLKQSSDDEDDSDDDDEDGSDDDEDDSDDDDIDVVDDVDDEERETLRSGIKELLSEDSEEESDDGTDDDILKKTTGTLLGMDKGISANVAPSSDGNSDSYLSETRFDQCSLSSASLKAIKDAGYERMTMVQEATLPVILKGKDVMAKAKTGTGKTVAFLLPSIETVAKLPPTGRDDRRPPISVLVICPTRELATQAATEANKLLKYYPSIGVQVVIGGTRLPLEQKRMQANPCQILVATPGRLKDHIENTAGFATRVSGVKVLVLDEADHLLDMGFRKDIERIIAAVPKQRQTLLFSATVPQEVRQICHIALKRDHEFINAVEEGSEDTHAKVNQMHLVAPLDKHFPMVYSLLKDHIADNPDYKVLVFCTTAMVTKLVADLLGELNLNVREIHSRKPQSYRTRVSDEFRKSKGLILVTSDVSARGVDYPDVTLVIQMGVPASREQYIHRLGRTGRKGKEGEGILLLAPWEEFFLSSVKDLPLSKASAPSVDPDTKSKVDRALSHVEMKNKESAYQAWLGYYNSNKNVGRDKCKLVELANEFSRSMGLDNPPAIPKLILGKMGLRNIPGLRSK